jgi:hypothetical protein
VGMRTLGFATSILPFPGVAKASGFGDVFDECCYYKDDLSLIHKDQFSFIGGPFVPGPGGRVM